MQLQENESYFHNIHTNWDWLSYVTPLEHFNDLKPQISEVCWMNHLIIDFCASHSDKIISLTYSMLAFSVNSFKLLTKDPIGTIQIIMDKPSDDIMIYILGNLKIIT